MRNTKNTARSFDHLQVKPKDTASSQKIEEPYMIHVSSYNPQELCRLASEKRAEGKWELHGDVVAYPESFGDSTCRTHTVYKTRFVQFLVKKQDLK